MSLAAFWMTILALAFSAVAAVRAAEMPADPREAILVLRREIARHDELYHRAAAPEISDQDYDRLKRRLADLEAAHPEIIRGLPARLAIGDDRTEGFATHRHGEPMLSLEKAYTATDLRAFAARLERRLGHGGAYVVEPKYDGMAVSLTFENGVLVRALTRGNGVEGDDISANLRRVDGAAARLKASAKWPKRVEVRGEVFVTFADFLRVNGEREAAGEPPFAQPRSLVVGTLRQRDPELVARRGLKLVCFGFGAWDAKTALPATQRELVAWFAEWGLPTPHRHWRVTADEDLERVIDLARNERSDFGFPTDGVVVKLDDLAAQRALGSGESAPHWAVAYKFAAERVETRVRAITLQVGRSGVLTPVAELVPVELAGSTVARATLHNRAEIERKDVRVGDFVYVEKAGEIIPAVTGVNLSRRVAATRAYEFPRTCPGCAAPITIVEGESAIRCLNRACPPQVRRRLEHFTGRDGVAIAGLGPATVGRLVEAGLVRDLPDLYAMRPEALTSRLGFSATAAQRLVDAIERSRYAELRAVVHGLGIPQIGAATARDIAKRCGTLADVLVLSGEDPAARAVAAYVAEPANRAVIEALAAAGVGTARRASVAPPGGDPAVRRDTPADGVRDLP